MKFVDMIRDKRVAVSPRADVTARLTDRYREEAKKTIWATGGCKSWYQDKDGVPII